MPQASLLVLSSNGPLTHLPFKLEQRSSRTSALLRLLLILPALVGVLVPLGIVAANAADVAQVAQARPLAAVQLSLAAILWMALFGLPAFGLVRRFGSLRTVHVDEAFVAISETGPCLRRGSTRPLSDFVGICHVIRTSLSGTRHELLLVDARRRDHVVFHAADTIAAETIMSASANLGLPEIHARELMRWPRFAA